MASLFVLGFNFCFRVFDVFLCILLLVVSLAVVTILQSIVWKDSFAT